MIGWLLVGCAVGSLDTPEGHEALRTALMTPTADGATLLLSNGQMSCDLPDPDDELAALDALFATCREGARHIVLELGADGGEWTATSATLVEVFEASVRSEDGLVRVLQVDEMQVQHIDEGISLDVAATDDGLRGAVELTAQDVSARFHAASCGADSELFEAVAAAGALSCP